MGNIFGVNEDTPYGRWPTDALKRLKDGLGRNGPLTEAQKKAEVEVADIIAERESSGVDYSSDGALSHPV
jgi:hypothetical protein